MKFLLYLGAAAQTAAFFMKRAVKCIMSRVIIHHDRKTMNPPTNTMENDLEIIESAVDCISHEYSLQWSSYIL